MRNSEFIAKVIDLFADRNKHTTQSVAKTAAGETCHVLSNKAVCWCLIGGISKVSYEYKCNARTVMKIIDQTIQQEYGTWGKGRFNDDYGYDAVVEMLHKAKELAIAQEQGTQ